MTPPTCDHPYAVGSSLICREPLNHKTGHVYKASSGGEVGDKHDSTSGGEH